MTMIRSIALACLCSSVLICAQQSATPTSHAKALDREIANFGVRDESFIDALSQLSREPIDDFHLGVEEVLREKFSNPVSGNPTFSTVLRNSSVEQILNVLCTYDSRYTWDQDGNTINVYPKLTEKDDSYLLNRHLDRISVIAIPDPEQGLTFLYKHLVPPEQIGYAGAGGDSSYPQPWTQTFERGTVRHFVNLLSEHMGFHTSWILAGAKQERYFTFLKEGFH